jgi:hypothetical protein
VRVFAHPIIEFLQHGDVRLASATRRIGGISLLIRLLCRHDPGDSNSLSGVDLVVQILAAALFEETRSRLAGHRDEAEKRGEKRHRDMVMANWSCVHRYTASEGKPIIDGRASSINWLMTKTAMNRLLVSACSTVETLDRPQRNGKIPFRPFVENTRPATRGSCASYEQFSLYCCQERKRHEDGALLGLVSILLSEASNAPLHKRFSINAERKLVIVESLGAPVAEKRAERCTAPIRAKKSTAEVVDPFLFAESASLRLPAYGTSLYPCAHIKARTNSAASVYI